MKKLTKSQWRAMHDLVAKEKKRIEDTTVNSSSKIFVVGTAMDSLRTLSEIDEWLHRINKWDTYE